VKNRAFKTTHKEKKTKFNIVYDFVNDTSYSSDTKDDELFFLINKLKKIMKKHRRRNKFCYECKKLGHCS